MSKKSAFKTSKRVAVVKRKQIKPLSYSNEYVEHKQKLFISLASLHSYHNYNVIYDNGEGYLLSSAEDFEGIKTYLNKYIDLKTMNTSVNSLSDIEAIMNHKHNVEKKITTIYICGNKKSSMLGLNHIFSIDESDLKEYINLFTAELWKKDPMFMLMATLKK